MKTPEGRHTKSATVLDAHAKVSTTMQACTHMSTSHVCRYMHAGAGNRGLQSGLQLHMVRGSSRGLQRLPYTPSVAMLPCPDPRSQGAEFPTVRKQICANIISSLCCDQRPHAARQLAPRGVCQKVASSYQDQGASSASLVGARLLGGSRNRAGS